MRDPESVDIEPAWPPREAEAPLIFADLVLDLGACTLARQSGEPVPLTRGEFALLRVFASRPGRVLSREALLSAVANRDLEPFDRSVDVQVSRLRRKIEPDPKRPAVIVTVPGSGYRLAAAVNRGRPAAATGPEAGASDAVSRAFPQRRHVTVLAAELSPAEGRSLPADPEDWLAMVVAFRRCAAAALAHYGSAISESRGREIVAFFGQAAVHENDAERAVRAALAIQRALSDLGGRDTVDGATEMSARIGLESGAVVVDARGEVFGDALTTATRLQAVAEPGSVLVTRNVQRQVAGLFVAEECGERRLGSASEPVGLCRIVRASGGGRRSGAPTQTPFVGREEELTLLARRWDRARSGEGQFVQIVGEPGVGKSRLIGEFRATLGEAPHTWVEWSSSQWLQSAPLHPIVEWGRQRFGADLPADRRLADLESTLRLVGVDAAEHAPLIASLLDIPAPPGLGAGFPPEDMRRRQLAALVAWILAGARSQSAALVFEDMQWADPTSLDLMRALAERGAQAPLLVIATARPEFRPPWVLRSHHAVISLAPLDRTHVARMVAKIDSSHALLKDAVEGMTERTGGVPLFVEEVTRLLLERGGAGGAAEIPPTLRQSLAARLDRLALAREVAQIGSVLGHEFDYELLQRVAETGDRLLDASLDQLAESDLLLVEGAAPKARYRFRHALIREAAYESLPRGRRKALHRRAAEALRDGPKRAGNEPELIAYHFAKAGLADHAVEWRARAGGDQAICRSAFREANAHLGKGSEGGSAVHRLEPQADDGLAMRLSRGVGAEQTQKAAEQTTQFAAGVDGPAAQRPGVGACRGSAHGHPEDKPTLESMEVATSAAIGQPGSASSARGRVNARLRSCPDELGVPGSGGFR